MTDDLDALTGLLREEITPGGRALVVRNTVRRVQETAQHLREQIGNQIPILVAHSRFLAPDRAMNDPWLLDRFGPPGKATSRPERYIVVASQVVESSLDIDFELLVTDLAPIDLLLQRMRRLHRHARTRPNRLTRARCLITGVDWSPTPTRPVQGSGIVYSEATLLRSAAVLWPHLDAGGRPVELPTDIPRSSKPPTQNCSPDRMPGTIGCEKPTRQTGTSKTSTDGEPTSSASTPSPPTTVRSSAGYTATSATQTKAVTRRAYEDTYAPTPQRALKYSCSSGAATGYTSQVECAARLGGKSPLRPLRIPGLPVRSLSAEPPPLSWSFLIMI
ncbi:hypothetical protein WEI85_20085 [Actinomycetes bacterium KLBMP 9797]